MDASTPLHRYLTPADVADLLSVPVPRVSRWARTGRLPCIVLPGGDLLFDPAELRAWLSTLRQSGQTGEVACA